jgi:hypothetical protein
LAEAAETVYVLTGIYNVNNIGYSSNGCQWRLVVAGQAIGAIEFMKETPSRSKAPCEHRIGAQYGPNMSMEPTPPWTKTSGY